MWNVGPQLLAKKLLNLGTTVWRSIERSRKIIWRAKEKQTNMTEFQCLMCLYLTLFPFLCFAAWTNKFLTIPVLILLRFCLSSQKKKKDFSCEKLGKIEIWSKIEIINLCWHQSSNLCDLSPSVLNSWKGGTEKNRVGLTGNWGNTEKMICFCVPVSNKGNSVPLLNPEFSAI